MSNLTKRERTYISACPDGDCRLQKTDLTRVQASPTHKAYYECKKHFGIVYLIEFSECKQCKKPFSVIPCKGLSRRVSCYICESKNAALKLTRLNNEISARVAKKIAKEKKANETKLALEEKKKNMEKKISDEKRKILIADHNKVQGERGEYCKSFNYCTKYKERLNCWSCIEMLEIIKGAGPAIREEV